MNYFRAIILLSFTFSFFKVTYSQMVFSESFDEAGGAMDGTDELGGVSWSSSCPDCVDGGDFFEVSGGKLVGQDTNGPASFTSDAIDISDCDNIEISFDLFEEGDMEACGTGCNSVDFVQFEYNIDGAGWMVPADAYFCGGACAGVMVIHSDDIDGGSMNYSTGCISGGGELEIRITIQAWAASERWLIDNVEVACSEGPAIDAGEDLTVCEGEEITLTADNPSAAELEWSGGVEDGESFIQAVGTVEYEVTASDGICAATDEVSVTVIEIPTAAILPSGPFLETDPDAMIVGSPLGGIWTADCIDCIDVGTGEFSPTLAGPGLWEVCYEVGDFPCLDVACVLIEVTEIPCDIDGEISSTSPTCFGFADGSVSIEISGEVGDLDYTITNEFGEIINLDGGRFVDELPEGWYYFEVTDELPCVFIDSVFIAEPTEIILTDFDSEPAFCRISEGQNGNGSVFAEATGGAPAYDYEWQNLESGEVMNANSWNGLNPGDYRLTVTDENGCSISNVIRLDSLNPIANFELSSSGFIREWEGEIPIDVYYENSSTNLINPNSVSSEVDLWWNFGQDTVVFTNDSNASFDINYSREGEYQVCLKVSNENGCLDSTCVLLNLYEPLPQIDVESPILFVPNAFTPDGYGANNVFIPIIASNVDPYDFNLKIYNRWGEILFETYDYSQGWDGTYGNVLVESGLYVWSIAFGDLQTDKKYQQQGHVTLLK